MDQRYVDTVRACKVILSNLDHLDVSATSGQRSELERLFHRVMQQIYRFVEAESQDAGLWVGEE